MLSAGLPSVTAALRAPVFEVPDPTHDLLCKQAPSTMVLGNAPWGLGPGLGGPHSSSSQPPFLARPSTPVVRDGDDNGAHVPSEGSSVR